MFRYQPLDQEKLEIRLVRFILDDHGNDDYKTDKPDDGGDSNDAGSRAGRRQRRSSDARSDCTSGPGPRSDCVLSQNIAMELRTVSLKEASIEYAALSYAWGNSDDIINITLDSHDFSVRRHLHAALEQLRGWNLTSWLWIDSVCIQQSDDVEKSWQVNAMHEVFKRAKLVYAWIGPGSTKTDTAMDYLARVGPRALACPEDPGDDLYNWMSLGLLNDYRALQEGKGFSSRGVQQTTGLLPFVIELLEEGGLYCPGSLSKPGLFTDATGALEGFQDMLSRQYWQRMWVIQEIALPQDVLLVCGGKCMSVDAFSIVVNIIHFGAWVFKNHRRPMGGDEDVPGLSSWSTFTERRPKALQVRRVIRSGQALRLADILLNWSIPADGEVYLTASDPRDLVFGVLAIVQDEQHGMIADYSLPHEDVFSMVTRALHGCNALQPSGDKFDLDCCSPKRGPTALPSWVPDWGEVSRHGFNDVFLQPIDVSRQFQATDSMDIPLYRTANDRQVRVLDRFGCRFDTITEPSRPTSLRQILSDSAVNLPSHLEVSVGRLRVMTTTAVLLVSYARSSSPAFPPHQVPG